MDEADTNIEAALAASRRRGGRFTPFAHCEIAALWRKVRPRDVHRVPACGRDAIMYCSVPNDMIYALCDEHERVCYHPDEKIVPPGTENAFFATCEYGPLCEDVTGQEVAGRWCLADAVGVYADPEIGEFALCIDHVNQITCLH